MDHYTHISYQERVKIDIYLGLECSISQIAKRIKRHRSTIYRELKRNGQKNKSYKGHLANNKAHLRRHIGVVSIKNNIYLQDYIKKRLEKGWSPEQISGRMKLTNFPNYVCHETIYRFIYGLKDKVWYEYLHYKKKNRGRFYGRKPKSCRYAEIKLIDQRPKEVLTRTEIGHWEGDTMIISVNRKENITTLVERKSRFLILRRNENKCSEGVISQIKDIIKKNPKKLWKTITFDQGSEFANYREIDRKTKCQSYFCYPHSPWQKGSNENMNGRLRRYIPRNIPIQAITTEFLQEISHKMNEIPRKCLGYLNPREALQRNVSIKTMSRLT